MGKKVKFVNLPIFSVATFRTFIYFAGGGGGSTGIPNQILIYERTVTSNPVNKIATGTSLYQNMAISQKLQLMVCSANQNILVLAIKQKGANLQKLYEIQVDQSLKSPTINSISFHPVQNIAAVGGDDSFVRFYQVSKNIAPKLIWSHSEHREQIKKIDSKIGDLFVSTDSQVAVVVNVKQKSVIKKLYRDQLNPLNSSFQAAFFFNLLNPNDISLTICHYIPRKQSYLTRELPSGQFLTLKISDDQCCFAVSRENLVGIACGKGETFMIDTQKMEKIGSQKGHEAIITCGTVTRGRKFITGTSSCSYVIQQENPGGYTWLWALVLLLMFILVVTYGFGSSVRSEEL